MSGRFHKTIADNNKFVKQTKERLELLQTVINGKNDVIEILQKKLRSTIH